MGKQLVTCTASLRELDQEKSELRSEIHSMKAESVSLSSALEKAKQQLHETETHVERLDVQVVARRIDITDFDKRLARLQVEVNSLQECHDNFQSRNCVWRKTLTGLNESIMLKGKSVEELDTKREELKAKVVTHTHPI